MKKSDLVRKLKDQNSELTMKESKEFVDLFFHEIVDALLRGDRVELRGFGSFGTRYKRSRKARNPKTGDEVLVDEKKSVYFKASEKLVRSMNTTDLD